MGQIKLPNFARPGSCEGAALVAEQLVFHQALGDGGAIQRDKGMIAALRQVMNGASEKLLARAAFAEEQNGGIGDGNALNLLAGFTDGGVFPDDARKPVACGVFLAQEQVLAKQFLLAGCALDKQLQVIEIDWLLKKVECAFLHGCNRLVDGAVCGEEKDGYRSVGLLGLAQDVEAGRAGHLEVREDKKVAPLADFLNRRRTVGGFVHVIAEAFERLAEHAAKLAFVFDEEQRFHSNRFYHESNGEHGKGAGRVRRREACFIADTHLGPGCGSLLAGDAQRGQISCLA